MSLAEKDAVTGGLADAGTDDHDGEGDAATDEEEEDDAAKPEETARLEEEEEEGAPLEEQQEQKEVQKDEAARLEEAQRAEVQEVKEEVPQQTAEEKWQREPPRTVPEFKQAAEELKFNVKKSGKKVSKEDYQRGVNAWLKGKIEADEQRRMAKEEYEKNPPWMVTLVKDKPIDPAKVKVYLTISTPAMEARRARHVGGGEQQGQAEEQEAGVKQSAVGSGQNGDGRRQSSTKERSDSEDEHRRGHSRRGRHDRKRSKKEASDGSQSERDSAQSTLSADSDNEEQDETYKSTDKGGRKVADSSKRSRSSKGKQGKK